jgi:hypothetical protein
VNAAGVARASLALWASALGGCLTVQPAQNDAGRMVAAEPSGVHSGRSAPSADDRALWPARWGDEIGTGVVVRLDPDEGELVGVRVGRYHDLRPDAASRAVTERLADSRVGAGGYRFRMEGPGAYIFVQLGDPPRGSRAPDDQLVFVSGTVEDEHETVPGEPEERVRVQRTWATYSGHRRDGRDAEDGDPGDGLVVIAPGLFGQPTPVIGSVVQGLRHAGWNVLRVLAPPARFTESVTVEMVRTTLEDMGDGNMSFELSYATEDFAELSGQRIAEYAYACEALVEWVRATYPASASGPAHLVTMSAGALSAPAILSRSPELYGDVILIAGGGNLFRITADSTYTPVVNTLEMDWTFAHTAEGRPVSIFDEEDRGTLLDETASAYLEAAPLDPLNLTGAFAGRRVVMLHGSADEAVPAASGDELWEALGRPERWVTPLDHAPLFLGLWLWTPKIVDWLEDSRAGVAP